MPVSSEFFITWKMNSDPSLFSFLAAVNEIIEAYVKSTSSLNPPVFLKASIIWLVIGIAFETFENSLRIKSVVLIKFFM